MPSLLPLPSFPSFLSPAAGTQFRWPLVFFFSVLFAKSRTRGICNSFLREKIYVIEPELHWNLQAIWQMNVQKRQRYPLVYAMWTKQQYYPAVGGWSRRKYGRRYQVCIGW
jgi:hypothetical protein